MKGFINNFEAGLGRFVLNIPTKIIGPAATSIPSKSVTQSVSRDCILSWDMQ